MEQLAAEGRQTRDIAEGAAGEALTAQEAHRQNIELLNALRETQAEFGQIQAEHSERLDAIDGKLGIITMGVHTVELLLTRLVNDEGAA